MCIVNTHALLNWENVDMQAKDFNEIEQMNKYKVDLKDNKESTYKELRKQIRSLIPKGEESKKRIGEVCMRVFSCECLCIVHLGCDV